MVLLIGLPQPGHLASDLSWLIFDSFSAITSYSERMNMTLE